MNRGDIFTYLAEKYSWLFAIMYREWGTQPVWNPLENARKCDTNERKIRASDEFCYICKKKGHPWRECPLLKVKKSRTRKTSQDARKINKDDLK